MWLGDSSDAPKAATRAKADEISAAGGQSKRTGDSVGGGRARRRGYDKESVTGDDKRGDVREEAKSENHEKIRTPEAIEN